MRGAPLRASTPMGESGIIPAYAGSTYDYQLKGFFKEDHPRVCGEHIKRFYLARGIPGSSPRMRGARVTKVWLRLGNRIIPAYAGRT